MVAVIINPYRFGHRSKHIFSRCILPSAQLPISPCPPQSPYKQQLGPMLLNCVVPCFKSQWGHLRAKAAWLSGVYSDTEFPDGKGQGATYTLLFQHVSLGWGGSKLYQWMER